MLLIIDNFDSFTYNLVQLFGEIGATVRVYRNDAIDLAGIRTLQPQGLVFSPGPGRPEEAGITLAAIREFAGVIPMLGVCLGHQAIAMAFGGEVVRAPELMHGKVSTVHHDQRRLFAGVENPLLATRYHSLMVAEAGLPACLEVTARSESGIIMGLRHRELPVEGVQFHPESIMTPSGRTLLQNFLRLCPAGPNPGVADAPARAEAATAHSAPHAENHKRAGTPMIQQAIHKVLERADLERTEAHAVMTEIMEGRATPAQIGAFLAALRMKGERAPEIAGFADAMRQKATPVPTRHRDAIDLCGTGGDGKGTFNISTAAAFVVAGAGVPVAKHGSHSVSSKCGSADVLRALGVNVDLTAAQMGECLDALGIAFLFAPVLHPAMRHAVGPRRELGTRTVFNILGPITNPAGVKRQMIGVFDRRLTTLLAEVLAELGTEQAMLVYGEEGLDEISLQGRTLAVELFKGRISERALTPEDFGLRRHENGVLGGTSEENARIMQEVLDNSPGPARDVVVANAACALWIAGAATLREGVAQAEHSLASGAAAGKLQALRDMTNQFQQA